MQTINLSKFDTKDIDAIIQNMKVTLPDYTLNQRRHHLARLLGANNWSSLQAALHKVEPIGEQTEDAFFLIRSVTTTDDHFIQTFAGKTMDEVCRQAYESFVSETFSEMIKEHDFSIEDDIYLETIFELLSNLGIQGKEHDDIVFTVKSFVKNHPDLTDLTDVDDDFVISIIKPNYAVKWYANMWDDEELIQVFDINNKEIEF